MRSFGFILLLLGILGFFYASGRVEQAGALPDGLSIGDTLGQPGGRWAMARFGCLIAAMVGAILALFPKGR